MDGVEADHVVAGGGRLMRGQGVTVWVIAEVGLVHQLVVKRGSHGHVVASAGGRAGRTCLLAFEEFGEDELLLVNHAIYTDALALDGGVEIV